MASTTDVAHRKLVDYLENAHAMERSHLVLLDSLAATNEDGRLADQIRRHRVETEGHAQLLERRLRQLGEGPSLRKRVQTETVARGKQVVDRVRTDKPGKNVRDGFMVESMEVASYELLERLAERAGDEETAALARTIREEEVAMANAFASRWDAAVADTVAGGGRELAERKLGDYLEDIQALEHNVLVMLSSVASSTHDPELKLHVLHHRDQTQEQGRRIAERLAANGRTPSVRKHAQSLTFAAVKGPLNKLRTDKAGKNARDLFIVEHMEVAAYELLERLAHEAGDEATATMAREHLVQERAMAAWVDDHWDQFMDENMLEAEELADSTLPIARPDTGQRDMLVVFDDTCSMCNRTVGWVRKVDAFGRFDYMGYSEAMMTYEEVAAVDLDEGVQVRFPDGSLTIGIDAVRSILLRTPLAPLGVLLSLPGVHQVANRVYREIAKRRPRACPIHRQ